MSSPRTGRLARFLPCLLVLVATAGTALAAEAPAARPARAGESPAWRTPPAVVADLLSAPRVPRGAPGLSPDGARMLQPDLRSLLPLATLAEPVEKLAGIEILPGLRANRAALKAASSGFSLISTADGRAVRAALPEGVRLGATAWSSRGDRVACAVFAEGGAELWIVDAASGDAKRLENVRLQGVPRTSIEWTEDGRSVLALLVPSGQGEPPAAERVPEGPGLRTGAGRATPRLRERGRRARGPGGAALARRGPHRHAAPGRDRAAQLLRARRQVEAAPAHRVHEPGRGAVEGAAPAVPVHARRRREAERRGGAARRLEAGHAAAHGVLDLPERLPLGGRGVGEPPVAEPLPVAEPAQPRSARHAGLRGRAARPRDRRHQRPLRRGAAALGAGRRGRVRRARLRRPRAHRGGRPFVRRVLGRELPRAHEALPRRAGERRGLQPLAHAVHVPGRDAQPVGGEGHVPGDVAVLLREPDRGAAVARPQPGRHQRRHRADAVGPAVRGHERAGQDRSSSSTRTRTTGRPRRRPCSTTGRARSSGSTAT